MRLRWALCSHYRMRASTLRGLGATGSPCAFLGCCSGTEVKLLCWGNPTWTLKVCKIMDFMAILGGLGLLFYILLGLR